MGELEERGLPVAGGGAAGRPWQRGPWGSRGCPGRSEPLLATPVGAASSRESTLNGFDQPGRGEPPISAPIKSTPGRARGLIAQSERRRQKS